MMNKKVKFLLVDDLDANLVALDGLLRRDGLELLNAHSGKEALELLLVHEVALALLDPWLAYAWIRRGWMSAYLGDSDGAVRELRTALHLMPF